MDSLRTLRHVTLRAALIAAVLLAGSAFTATRARADTPPLDHLRVTVNGPTSVTLAWDPLPGAQAYTPEFYPFNIGWNMWGSTVLTPDTTTYTYDGPPYMICNTTYLFTVTYRQNVDTGANLPYTDTVQATTPPCPAPEPGRWAIPEREYSPRQVYGTQGVPDGANTPGWRTDSAFTRDASGNIWLYGGLGQILINCTNHTVCYPPYADLWKWNGLSWVWVTGPDRYFPNADMDSYPPVYGAIGQADPSFHPGTMNGAHMWADSSGNIWLYDVKATNQIWKWDGASWALMDDCSASCPTAKSFTCFEPEFWSDAAGHLWMYGGAARRNGGYGSLNEMWEWNGSWALLNGSTDSLNAEPVYGTQGVPDPANTPGGRANESTWADASGNLWLFGGYVGRMDSGFSLASDLWKWDGSAWTWVSGPNTPDSAGIYGTQGVADPADHPGARLGSALWGDQSGNLWLFGGDGYDVNGPAGHPYDPDNTGNYGLNLT